MEFKKKLSEFGFNTKNSIVIGSGILEALDIRKSNDIDLVVERTLYDKLKNSDDFILVEKQSRNILKRDMMEIGNCWYVLGKDYYLEDLEPLSTVIDGVRYLKVEFLFKVKKSWVDNGTVRPKDIEDILEMQKYISTHPAF